MDVFGNVMENLKTNIKNIKKYLKTLEDTLETKRGNRMILCASCKKKHRIKNLAAIQTHWYVEPYGCTGGAYWNEGELQFICPTTNVINRILFFNDRDTKYAEKFRYLYKHLFKFTASTYSTPDNIKWVNNEYVSHNLKKFELTDE